MLSKKVREQVANQILTLINSHPDGISKNEILTMLELDEEEGKAIIKGLKKHLRVVGRNDKGKKLLRLSKKAQAEFAKQAPTPITTQIQGTEPTDESDQSAKTTPTGNSSVPPPYSA